MEDIRWDVCLRVANVLLNCERYESFLAYYTIQEGLRACFEYCSGVFSFNEDCGKTMKKHTEYRIVKSIVKWRKIVAAH